MTDEPLYSTASGSNRKKQKQNSKKKQAQGPAEGPCKMRLETKGRGGKSVTVLFNLPFDQKTAKSKMKDIQGRLGCGATLKNGTIEFRGDIRDDLLKIFDANGEKLVPAGG